jgi:hypothetical protein
MQNYTLQAVDQNHIAAGSCGPQRRNRHTGGATANNMCRTVTCRQQEDSVIFGSSDHWQQGHNLKSETTSLAMVEDYSTKIEEHNESIFF